VGPRPACERLGEHLGDEGGAAAAVAALGAEVDDLDDAETGAAEAGAGARVEQELRGRSRSGAKPQREQE
jgi:hypothetical protein